MTDKSKKIGAANDKPRVFSLQDLNNNDNSSEDEKQTYYAGGEKSGMAVQGRDDSKNKNSKEAQGIMDKILSQASSDDPSKKQSPKYFSGSGRKLSGIESESQKVSSKKEKTETKIVAINLIFWSDGFTLGEGPLRPFNDPYSVRFLDSLQNGLISAKDLGIEPTELADIKISQLSNQPFDANKQKEIIKATNPLKSTSEDSAVPVFAGTGSKLGIEISEASVVIPDLSIEIDSSITVTRVQIVLPNGSRKIITISARAKVSELYNKIREEIKIDNFVLKTVNPSKSIPEDLDALLYQIGILNSSIVLSNK